MSGISYGQRYFEDVCEGEELPRVEDFMSFRRVIMTPGATWDYFPGHHDADYARAQGQPTIYVNTMLIMGLADRLVTDWGGPATFVTRRKVRLHRSVYAGDTVIGTGVVSATRREGGDGRIRHLVDVDLLLTNQLGAQCASAAITAELPSRDKPNPARS